MKISEFLGRDKEVKKPPHAIAKELRKRQLDMMDYGVIGSSKPIPRDHTTDAVKLPHLLRYSGSVLAHFRTFRGVLNEPREFQIVDRVGQLANEDDPKGDVIYQQEGPDHVYYFAHHLTGPYLNSWAAALDNVETGKPYLNIAFAQTNQFVPRGGWHCSYYYLEYDDTSLRVINSSNLQPEKDMTINFWYSLKRLDGRTFLENFPACENTKAYISLTEERETEGFKEFVFRHDALSHAEEKAKIKYRDDLAERYSRFLIDKGNRKFSIVEVGTVELGDRKHWVYTGSEQAEIPERVSIGEKVKQPVFKLAFNPVSTK